MIICALLFNQVQIFTRDGAFVRKFGATVLQHPRGVTVDFRGRIVVVECKVRLAGKNSSEMTFMCWMGCKTITQWIHQCVPVGKLACPIHIQEENRL